MMTQILAIGFIMLLCVQAFGNDELEKLMKKYANQIDTLPDAKTASPSYSKKEPLDKPSKKLLAQESSEDRAPASTTAAKPAHPTKIEEKAVEIKAADSFLFGDWGGLKGGLKSRGIDVQLRYKGDLTRNFSGGLEQKTVSLGNLDITADFDLEKIAGIKGLNLVLYGLDNHGGHPTEFVGDSFATSNIEAPSTFKLYEAYLKQTVDDRFTVLFGLRDLNADYYATESSGGLLNSAFGIGPSFSQTGVNGPSIFPSTAPALAFKYESPSSFYFQSGVFNATAGDPNQPNGTHIPMGVDNGYLYVWEIGFAGGSDASSHKYSVGSWSYSKEADALDTAEPSGHNSGLYFLFDRNLSKDVSVFIKHGLASPRFNQFSSSTEVGVKLQGLLSGRTEDTLSLGFASASVSDDYKTTNDSKDTEAVAELSYRINLEHGISLTPDFQYVKNPGVARDIKDAQIGSMRIEINF